MAFENNALGIDVSLWQKDLDWAALKRSGVSFAFAKASEGDNITDPYFAKNRPAIKAAGIVRSAYHFFRPAKDPLKQAALFVQTASPEDGDLPLALDVESSGGLAPGDLVATVQACLTEIERLSGVRPIIYTAPNFWNTSVAVPDAPAWTSDYLLWIANYTSAPKPFLPKGWTTWAIWQYNEQGKLDGCPGNLDLNRYTGSPADLLQWAASVSPGGGQPVRPVDTVPEEVTELVGNYIQAVNARDFDGLAALYAPTGVRMAGSGTAQGPQDIRKWYVDWLTVQFPGGSFTLGEVSAVSATTWLFAWTCHTPKGDRQGRDTVGMQAGKLHYHATSLE